MTPHAAAPATTASVSPLAGQLPARSRLTDVPRLVTSYYTDTPDPTVPGQQVAFGTSGHRGSAFERTFNEWHVLAISQAICEYRLRQHIDGPLYLGMDTHALSIPARATVQVMIAEACT
jgi:phosphoglucomutase